MLEPWVAGTDMEFVVVQSRRILLSYRHWLKRDLMTAAGSAEDQARMLFEAPFVVASSDAAADPILNYGNQAALALWELSWPQFTQTPGRETAEPMEREARARFLSEVKRSGFIENYQGIRISGTGRRFKIERATVWNLLDERGRFCGQAVMFKDWSYLP